MYKPPPFLKIARSFIQQFGWVSGGRSILHGARQVIQACLIGPNELSSARMKVCLKCPIYSSQTQTCGDINETYTDAAGQKRTLGCHCFLPLATRIESHDCYGRSHDLPFGWDENLRPKQH